jgi:hypothetical protein
MKNDENLTFGYSAVEAALAVVFKAKAQILILRARLKSLQRSGLTPEKPGRGKVIKYSVSNVYDLAWALALTDFGLVPDSICSLVSRGYFSAYYVQKIEKLENDRLFFCLMPYVLNEKALKFHNSPVPFVMLNGSDISGEQISKLGGRLALIDMTWLKRSVDEALGVS